MKNLLKILVPFGLLFIIIGVVGTYTWVRDEIGIRSNGKVINRIKMLIDKNQSDFQTLNSFLTSVETYSTDFKINNHPKQGITFYSYTDWEKSEISFDEYKRKYYEGISNETSPCYVPDFDIPKDLLLSIMEANELRYVRLEIECGQKKTSFKFKYRTFYPTDRTLLVHYYTNGICDSIKLTKNLNPKGYNWNYQINTNWLIESKKTE